MSERKALEARLDALQAENKSRRSEIHELTRRACILLATARLELKRKGERLTQQRKKAKHQRQPGEPCGQQPSQPQRNLGGGRGADSSDHSGRAAGRP